MSDFAKFCPKCYAFFRDPDLYAKHVEVCGFAKKKAEAVKEPKKTAGKKIQPSGDSGKKEDGGEQVEVENKSSDSSLLTPDSSPLPSAVSTEGGSPKSPKFKT